MSEFTELSGRDLDAVVAERVMGFVRHRSGVLLPDDKRLHIWSDHTLQGLADRGQLWDGVPAYSESIEAAMEVITKLRDSRQWCCISLFSDYNYAWKVSLSRAEPENAEHTVTVFEVDEWLPKAICRVALRAMEQLN